MTRIEELEELIKKYAQAYYSGNSEVEDGYFDSLTNELRSLNPDSEVLNKIGWGYDPREKKPHLYNLTIGSLNKVKDPDNIPTRFDPEKTYVSAKLDGLSVVCYYENGRRVDAITRGNGKVGKSVLTKINQIDPQTRTVPGNFTGAVRGEVLISQNAWGQYCSDHPEVLDNPSANPRNYAAGILNRNETDSDINLLSYVTYKILYDKSQEDPNENSITQSYVYNKLHRLGFKVVLHDDFSCKWNIESLKSSYSNFNYFYPCDGLVLTTNPELENGHLIYDEIAFKFESESAEVVVTDVDWNATRTGRIVPRIWFDPVELSGALVRKCTGFNAEFIKDSKINKGTVIKVTRSGEVIPHILKVVSNPCEVGLLPKTCPRCGKSLHWEGVDLVCDNESTSQLPYKFISTVGSSDNAGASIYQSICDAFNLKDDLSLIKFLKDFDIVEYCKVLRESTNGNITYNLKCSILKKIGCYSIDAVTFLIACNIPGISWKTADTILSNYPNYISDIKTYQVNYDRISEIKGIGSSTILTLKSSECLIHDLAEVCNVEDYYMTLPKEEMNFKVAITGSLSVKRSEFESKLREHAIELVSNLKECKYLITNNPESTSSKMNNAKKYGVQIISEKEFSEKYFE